MTSTQDVLNDRMRNVYQSGRRAVLLVQFRACYHKVYVSMGQFPWGLDGDCDEAIEVLDARQKAGFHGVVNGWRETRKGR